MKDKDKTQKQSSKELTQLRQRIAELEASESKRKKFEEALRMERDKAQHYLDIAEVILVALNKKGKIILINRKGNQILGYKEGELLGKDWFTNCVPSHRRKKLKSGFLKLIASERKLTEFYENPILTKSGTERIITWHNTLLKDAQGTITGTLSSGEDITERKKAEEKLRESEEHYKTLFDEALDGICLADAETGIIIDCNEAMAALVRRERANLIGKPQKILHPPQDDEEAFSSTFKQHLTNKEGLILETQVVTKTGDIREVEIKANLLDLQGRKVLQGLFRDITERKKAGEALRKSEHKYRTILKNIEEGYYEVDLAGNFTFFNDAMCRIWGYPKEELLGMNNRQYADKENAKRLFQAFNEVYRTGKPGKGYDYEIIKKDRTRGYVEASISLQKDSSGKAIGFRGIIRDITERKKAEKELRESEERFRLAFENANTGVCLVDLEGNLTRVNRKMCEIFGYTKEELEHMTVNDIAHPEDVDLSPEFIQKTLRGELDRTTFEKRYFHKKGHVVTCEVSSSLVHNAEGAPLYFISHVNDITERKHSEESLRESEKNFRLSLDDSPLGIRIVTAEGETLYANQAALEIYGYDSVEELQRTPVKKRYRPESYAEFKTRKEKRDRGEFGPSEYEISIVRKNGEVRRVQVFRKEVMWNGQRQFQVIYQDITERKKAEAQIRESQLRFQGLVETLSDWIWEADENGVYTYVSPRVQDLLGFEPEEILGKTPFDLMPPEEADRVKGIFASLMSERQPLVTLENTCRHKDGRLVVFETSGAPFFDADGQFKGYRGVDRDITERKRLEEILERDREDLKLIIDSSPIIVFYKDKKGRLIRVNRTFAEAMKMSEGDIVGKTVFDFYSPQIAQGMADDDQEVLQSGRPKLNIIEHYESASGIRWVQTDKIPIFDNHGNPIGLIGFAQDITERKQAEETAHESETRFRMLFEAIPDSILVHDDEGTILHVNEIGARQLEWSAKDLVGRNVREIVTPENRALIADHIRETHAAGWSRFETTYVSRSGWKIVAEVNDRPIKFGKKKAILRVARDITERKQAEEALQKSEERYRDLVENISDIIYVTDEKGIITYISPAIEPLSGYTLPEVIGRPFFDFVYQEDMPEAAQLFQQDISGQSVPHEYRMLTKDGDVRWVRVSSRSVFEGDRAISLHGILTDITERKQADEAVKHGYEQLHETFHSTVSALASAVEMKDQYTAGHQPRVTQLASAIAEEMGLSSEQIEGIRMAASIHDIGKIMVPAEILNKPGPLTEIQYEMIKMHPRASYDILKGIKFPWPVAQIVLQHHERLDGSGYPQQLAGEEIIVEARILAVANVVEAMNAHRPYRPAYDIKEALAEISKNRGTLYDPAVVDACLRLFTEKGFTLDPVAR